MPLRKLAIALGVLLAFVLLTVWLLAPLSTAPATSLYDAGSFVGIYLNQADVALNGWILAWGTHALTGGNLSGFFDANIFYPTPRALAHSEHMLGVQPLFAPLYLATGNLTLALNLWILTTFVLCGVAMYWVSLRWFGSHTSAAVASALYAFGPWRFYELTHAQVLSVQYLPLLAYAVWRATERRDAAVWVSIVALAAVQALSSYYLGYMGFFLAGIVALVCVFACRDVRSKYLLFIATALSAALLLMVPASLPYVTLAEAFGPKPAPLDPWGAARNFLFPVFPSASGASWSAWGVVPWIALIGALLGFAIRAYRARSIALALVAVFGFWLAMGGRTSGAGIHTGPLQDVMEALIPGWAGVRVMNRFGILTWLALSLLAAIPFAYGTRWLQSLRTIRWLVAGALVVAVLVASASVNLLIRPSPEVSYDLRPYQWLAEHGEGAPLLEWPAGFSWDGSEYMYLSTLHWLPLVNGYSGYRPATNHLLNGLVKSLPEAEATKTLIKLNVARWLLVHRQNTRYGSRVWKKFDQTRAELRLETDAALLYELPFDPDRPPALSPSTEPGRSLFGTPLTTLRAGDLEAQIVPLRKRNVDVLYLWLMLPLRVRNLSSVVWPSVAVEQGGVVGLTFRARRAGTEEALTDLRGFSILPTDLGPGMEAIVWATFYGPREPGLYEVVPCLSQRRRDVVRCFDVAESHIELEVPRAPRQPK